MLSLTCQTAIRAVIYLASRPASEGKAGIREIASQIDASEHSVGKLLQTLVKEQVLQSTKGPNGGFFLTAAQLRQPLIRVVEAIDGKDVFRRCGLGFHQCSGAHPCPIHHDYKTVRDEFERLCRGKKISDLSVPVSEGMAYLFG